ncbi:MAG: hypothetical protein E7528_07335 [Ruminococcaceae bacterium]|nr:hypothetical protein [Oscillospiraceae bacterium]
MREDLEDLWNYYLIEVPIKDNKKEKLIKSQFSRKEKTLRSKLTQEQLDLLNEYDDMFSELSRISERHAFIKGIMFATRFIFQALYND